MYSRSTESNSLYVGRMSRKLLNVSESTQLSWRRYLVLLRNKSYNEFWEKGFWLLRSPIATLLIHSYIQLASLIPRKQLSFFCLRWALSSDPRPGMDKKDSFLLAFAIYNTQQKIRRRLCKATGFAARFGNWCLLYEEVPFFYKSYFFLLEWW